MNLDRYPYLFNWKLLLIALLTAIIAKLCYGDTLHLSTGFILTNVRVDQREIQSNGSAIIVIQTQDRMRRIPENNILKIIPLPYNKNAVSEIIAMPDSLLKHYNITPENAEAGRKRDPIIINQAQSDSTFLYNYFSTEIPIRTISVESDTTRSTNIQRMVNQFNQLNIVERKTIYEYKTTLFFSSVVRMAFETIKVYGNGSPDTSKGLIITINDYQSQYIWRDRTAYIDYDEIESLYRAIIEIESLYKSWNGKLMDYYRHAKFRSLDNFSIQVAQHPLERNPALLLSTGLTYPSTIRIEWDELPKIKHEIQSAVRLLN
jgi:hypothetical protein